MLVRIRFAKGPQVVKKRRKNRRIAAAVAALLNPAAAMAGVVGVWRIAADLNWAGSFAIRSGFFSHWQVWLGGAILLELCSRALSRYGRSGDREAVS
jgi:hypothetical protein